jgi:hypothetical protein
LAPASRTARGPTTPSQIPIGCAGRRPGLQFLHLVVLSVVSELLPGPAALDDVDGLAQRLPRLPYAAPRAAHAGDPVPECARADPQLEPAAAEQVDGGGLFG